jgi:hypothetical protein
VPQRLCERATECLARAGSAEQRALAATDPEMKANYADVARRWRRLAESYQFVDRVENFLTEMGQGTSP